MTFVMVKNLVNQVFASPVTHSFALMMINAPLGHVTLKQVV
jgi:hypothetical protein